MLRNGLSKLFYAFLTLLGVVTLVFFLFNVLPGDPAQMMLGQNQSSDQLELVKKKYGFDLPVSKQYLLYLNDLSPISIHSTESEDMSFYSAEKYSGIPVFANENLVLAFKWPYLRTSYQKRGKKVSTVISETLFNTMILAVTSIGIAIFFGIILGIVAAMYYNSWVDRWLQFISTLGMSVPSFFSAILFSWFFGFLYHDYTGLNMSGNLYEMDDFGEGSVLQLKNLLLPAVVLGIRPIAVIIQLMRSSLLEVLSQDYIKTAYSKGLSTFEVIYKHGIKNALNPVVTVISGWFASLLAGAVFVEYIFGWKGMGKEIVTALNTLDIPVIIGIVLTLSSLFIMINLMVDFIYAQLDPKVKLF
ncbi:MAG: ABC transporter permease [Flavobacteriaceae bacterium]